MNVVAHFKPTKWRVQKLEKSQWVLVGDYDSLARAEARAKDLAQFYVTEARVLELPK